MLRKRLWFYIIHVLSVLIKCFPHFLRKKLYALVWIPLETRKTSTKPRSLTNILHSLHGQSLMVQDLILALKADNVEVCFIYLVISFHNLSPKLDIVSEPKYAVCMFLRAKCIPLLKFYLSFSWKLKTLFIIIVERPFVVCQRGQGGWCPSVGGVGDVLKWLALVIVEETPG